jgi:hypothetical protein
VLMPIGTTSYADRSITDNTLAAVEQDTACSLERPPKTTATRGFRVLITSTLTVQGRVSAGPRLPTTTMAR